MIYYILHENDTQVLVLGYDATTRIEAIRQAKEARSNVFKDFTVLTEVIIPVEDNVIILVEALKATALGKQVYEFGEVEE